MGLNSDKKLFGPYLVDFLCFFGFWGGPFLVFIFIFGFLKILKTFLESASKFIIGQNSERNPFLTYFIDFFGWKKILTRRRRRRRISRRRKMKVFLYWLDNVSIGITYEATHDPPAQQVAGY